MEQNKSFTHAKSNKLMDMENVYPEHLFYFIFRQNEMLAELHFQAKFTATAHREPGKLRDFISLLK